MRCGTSRWAVGVLLSAIGWAGAAQATVLIDENFDGRMTGDSIPDEGAFPNNGVWKFDDTGSAVRVVGTVGTNATKSAELAIGASGIPQLGADWAEDVKTGVLDVRFSIRGTNNGVFRKIFVGSKGYGANAVTVLRTGTGDTFGEHLFALRTGNNEVDLGQVLPDDGWVDLRVVADLDTETFQVFSGTNLLAAVGPVDVAGTTNFGFPQDWDSANGNAQALSFGAGFDNGPTRVAGAGLHVDNILVQHVPEPGSIALLALGGLAALARPRRRIG
jgi:hypothetical protein